MLRRWALAGLLMQRRAFSAMAASEPLAADAAGASVADTAAEGVSSPPQRTRERVRLPVLMYPNVVFPSLWFDAEFGLRSVAERALFADIQRGHVVSFAMAFGGARGTPAKPLVGTEVHVRGFSPETRIATVKATHRVTVGPLAQGARGYDVSICRRFHDQTDVLEGPLGDLAREQRLAVAIKVHALLLTLVTAELPPSKTPPAAVQLLNNKWATVDKDEAAAADFSMWVAGILPVNESLRLTWLKQRSATVRLQSLLHVLQSHARFVLPEDEDGEAPV